MFGARVLQLGDHLEFSGALYPFSRLHARPLLNAIPEYLDNLQADAPDEDPELDLAHYIVEHWFAQLTLPPPMPEIVDASTGQPILLVTDHFRVLDRGALEAALSQCADLECTGDDEWQYFDEDEHGTRRPRLRLSLGQASSRSPDRIELFCRTRQLADEGRAWFETLAGGSVKHLTRELVDPAGAMQGGGGTDTPPKQKHPRGSQLPPDLSPEELSEIVSEVIRRNYADWADEPIPALGGRTPREAITTPGGLERVKGLLRSYEHGEISAAREQHREPVSFKFLWDELGITRVPGG